MPGHENLLHPVLRNGGPRGTSRGLKGRFPHFTDLVLLLAVSLFLVWPALALVIGMLFDNAPGTQAQWGLGAFERIVDHPHFPESLLVTLVMTAVIVPAGMAVGLAFALVSGLAERGLARVLDPLVLIAFTLPPLFYALSYAVLGTGRGGAVNAGFAALFGFSPGINFTSWNGLLFVSLLRAAAAAYIYLSPAVRNLTRSGDEAAQISGASLSTRLFHIILPQLRPALSGTAIVLIIVHLALFDAVLILGGPQQITNLSVLSYLLVQGDGAPDYPAASAIGLLILLATLGLVVLQRRVTHVARSATVSGRSEPGLRIRLPRAVRMVVFVLAGIWVFFLFAVPLASIGLTSLTPFPGVYTNLGFGQYLAVLGDGSFVRSLLLTLGIAGGAAVIGVAASLWILNVQYARPQGRLSGYINVAVMMPIAMSGVVGAIGYVWAILLVPGGVHIYGTPALLVIVLSASVIPGSVLLLRGAYLQFDEAMVEAARISGCDDAGAFLHTRLPLMLPAVVNVLYIAFIGSAGALDTALILGNASMRPLPALIYESYANTHFAKAATLLVFLLLTYALVRLALQVVVWIVRRDLRPSLPFSRPRETGRGSVGAPERHGLKVATR